METGARLLCQPTRAVMVRGEFQIAPLDFILVLAHIFNSQIRNWNLTGHEFEVILIGDFLLQVLLYLPPVSEKRATRA